jgi:hypothetical protein
MRFNPKAKLDNSRVRDVSDNPYETQENNYVQGLIKKSRSVKASALKRRLNKYNDS